MLLWPFDTFPKLGFKHLRQLYVTYTSDLLTVTIQSTSFNAVIGSNSQTLGCTITGTPQATSVTWTKTVGGQTTDIDVASNSGKYSGSTVSSPSLIIQSIAQSDEGNYVCTATNVVGTSSSQAAFFDVTGSKWYMFFSKNL